MSQHQETATDRLVSIIQLIQLGRRTGVLTARRGEGTIQEKGTITFVKGKVTEANVGRRTGSEALNSLTTWGSCRFTFAAAEETNTPLPLPISSDGPAETKGDTDPNLLLRPQQPFADGKRTGPLGAEGNAAGMKTENMAGPVLTAPYRVRPIDASLRMMESRGLTRSHRHLFLLIDGQRSLAELVRLMGRSPNEVYDLLRDLEKIGVIQILPYRQ